MKSIENGIKRVLVVGSWAKEQITIEHLKRDPGLEIHAYMDTMNPGIARIADDCHVGCLDDAAEIAGYAREADIDLALITTASPLEAGAADMLEDEAGIPAFGPRQSAARLESDKAFARELVAAEMPEAVPSFALFSDHDEAVRYARELNCEVAVKPIGLTDGLGVRVRGDQLAGENEVLDYIREVLDRSIGGSSQVIVEEKISGEEFTLQCLVNDDLFLTTPAVQDFKKLLPGEKGPNTASMGSYSAPEPLLPFMKQEDWDQALRIIENTLTAFRARTGQGCRGFLYGQFMLTGKGIKLVEYNFRPGDPEWMNTMAVMESSLLDAVTGLMLGEAKPIHFSGQATVCKYVVPPDYPMKLNQTLRVRVDEKALQLHDVHMYHSCGLDSEGALNVGHERGMAFIAQATSIADANRRVEAAIAAIEGEFYHRGDIGTEALLREKAARAEELRR